MTRRGRSSFAIPVAAFALCSTGCGLVGLGDDERLGLLSRDGETMTIYVPASVEPGERFAVHFYTFGGGCISRGRTDLSVNGREATVTPYDIHSGNGTCTDDITFLDHTVWFHFDLVGVATVRVRGRGEPGDRSVVREFEVTVQVEGT